MQKFDKEYNLLFIKLDKVRDDNEKSHIIQDKIYRKFIKDICNDKINTLADIKILANMMNNNVVKKDKARWYA